MRSPRFLRAAFMGVVLSTSLYGQCFDLLVGSDSDELDAFGLSLAQSGGDLVISTIVAQAAPGFDTGAAYVFTRTGGVWTEVQKIVSPEPEFGETFGYGLAVSGDTLLIGDPQEDLDNLRGKVYFYERGPNGFELDQALGFDSGNPFSFDLFGSSAVMDGDRALVSGHLMTQTAVLERGVNGWEQTHVFQGIGEVLALDGNTAIVSGGSCSSASPGDAMIYEWTPNGWTGQLVFAIGGQDADCFGAAVALDGDVALISAPFADNAAGVAAGAVYVFERGVNGWSEGQQLTASDGEENDYFGWKVAIEGEFVLVTAYQDDDAADDAGAVYVFRREAGMWMEVDKLVPDGMNSYDDPEFGAQVLLDGEIALVSDYHDDAAADWGGAVHVIPLVPGAGPVYYCASTANSTGAPAEIEVQGCGSVAANQVVLVAQPVPDQPGLFFYGDAQTQVPFGNGFRCVDGMLYRLPVEVGDGGALRHVLEIGDPPSAMGQISAGSVWNFQAWFRDPAAGFAGFDLSDAASVGFVR